MNHANLQLFGDDHLCASVRAAFNPLVTTPLEVELAARLESLLDDEAPLALLDDMGLGADELDELRAALVDNDFDESMRLLHLLKAHGIFDCGQLRAALKPQE